MLILRDPAVTSQVTDPSIHELVSLRFRQILAGEPYDYDRHGYMVIVESGDTVEQLEQEIGLPLLRSLFDDLPYGDPDFTPCGSDTWRNTPMSSTESTNGLHPQ